MRHLSLGKRTRTHRPVTVGLAAPLALCGLLLTGCSGDDEPASESDRTSLPGGSLPGGEQDGPGNGPEDSSGDEEGDEQGDQAGDGEVDLGDVEVGTELPDGFPADLPLPEKDPTSVVTVGGGGGEVGGGWSLNYDGVSMEEIEQMLQDGEAAGYELTGPFENGSAKTWGLKSGTTTALVVFAEESNLSITVTKIA